MPWYQRCGIEPPLPLRSVLAWPVLWAYGWIAEKLHRPIVHVPDPVTTFRFYDEHYNFVGTLTNMPDVVLIDCAGGQRYSFRLDYLRPGVTPSMASFWNIDD